MEPIRGQATLRAEDFKTAWRALPEVRRFVFGGSVLMLVWSVGAAMSAYPAFIVVPIGALAIGYGMLQGRARWTAAGIQGFGGGAVKYVFDEYGYHLDAPGRQLRLEWAALHRHIETKDALLIYSSAQVATLVPKRAFDSADQSRLLAELHARLQPPKQRSNSVTKMVVIWVVLIVAFLAATQLLLAPAP